MPRQRYTIQERAEGRLGDPRWKWAIVDDDKYPGQSSVIVARRLSEADASDLAGRLNNTRTSRERFAILRSLTYEAPRD